MKTISRVLLSIVLITPIFLFFAFILLFGARVPHWDDWKLIVDLVQRYYTGTLTIYDFSEPYNGYILIFPRLVYLSLGIITKVNIFYNMIFLWLIMISNLIILFFAFKKSFGHHKNYLVYFIPVPWLLFTLAQWENLCYGVTLCGYLSILGLLIALYCLDTLNNNNIRFLISIFGGILSTFSYISGLLTWPLGLCILLCTKGIKSLYTITWAIISGGIYSLYFLNWAYPTQTLLKPEISNIFFNDAIYFLTNLGSPFGPMESPLNSYTIIVFLFGLIIALLSVSISSLIIKKNLHFTNIFWVCLLVFSFLISFMTMLGRVQYGSNQATSPRYIAFTIFSVIGLYCLLVAINYDNLKDKKHWPRYILGAFIVMIICGSLNGYIGAYHSLNERHEFEETTYTQTILNYNTVGDEKLINNVLPNILFIRDKIEFLDKYNLSIFDRH